MVSLHDAEDSMVSELKVSLDEARVYLLLLNKGKMVKTRIAEELKLEQRNLEKSLTGLVEKGACIELGGEYEALNPRFAITNMYRMMCYTNNIEVKRNVVVDQLATMLEKPYEDARTK
ncbi:MAG TPA: helix-turn-helix domain-containing protein [Nitrososphaerales archaeon]|nr:helix-turn-helix domain-containing protein [Nitrososphaerales archaeon]